MPIYTDCYCLVKSRNKKLVIDFLNYFLPNRNASTEEVIIMLDGKELIFCNQQEKLIRFLEEEQTIDVNLYWNNLDLNSSFNHAMVFYTNDGNMIFGISTSNNNPKSKKCKEVYEKLKKFTNAQLGCITVEEVAPCNSLEFKKFCKERYTPR